MKANLEICLIDARLGLIHYGHLFKSLFLTGLGLESHVRIYCLQDIVKYVSFCVCVKENWQVFCKWTVHANAQQSGGIGNIFYCLLEKKDPALRW